MIEVRTTRDFDEWFARLRDRRAKHRIQARIDRMEMGNPGDVKSVGHGVHEMRIKYGPGYRLYFVANNSTVVILLCGGDKATQHSDIRAAHALARQLKDGS